MRKALYVMGILDDEDLDWIAAHGRRLDVAEGDVLIEQGVPVDSVFILLDGSLRVNAGGQQVATLFSGEIVGEISFVDSLPPSATVTASERSRVVAIPRDLLHARLQSDAWFSARFFRAVAVFLADRLRATTARLAGAHHDQDEQMPVEMMDSVSLAAVRFDRLLKQLV